jgi:hypothetical protein
LAAEAAQAQELLATANTSLAQSTEALAQANAQIAELQAAAEQARTASASLASIVSDTVKAMSIPLNLPTSRLANLDSAALVAEYTETLSLYKAKITSGGVAATTRQSETSAQADQPTSAVNPLFQAAALASRLTRGK